MRLMAHFFRAYPLYTALMLAALLSSGIVKGIACKLHQSITGWHAGPVKNAADLDILVINWGHSL
jgi:hypothetical protein